MVFWSREFEVTNKQIMFKFNLPATFSSAGQFWLSWDFCGVLAIFALRYSFKSRVNMVSSNYII